jgi:hypothetical protein
MVHCFQLPTYKALALNRSRRIFDCRGTLEILVLELFSPALRFEKHHRTLFVFRATPCADSTGGAFEMPHQAATVTVTFDWQRFPHTEMFLDRLVAEALDGNAYARDLEHRMRAETSTRFVDWIDHLVLSKPSVSETELIDLGYALDTVVYSSDSPVYVHQGGLFPRLAVVAGSGSGLLSVALKVESIADFLRANDLCLPIQGPPLGPYRRATISGTDTALEIIERRAYRGFDVYPGELARQGRMGPHAARDALRARELWQTRRRHFEEDSQGFEETDALLTKVLELVDRDLACHLIFEVERDYWQSRNRAARVQKSRQDRLGLGWANHDHHTFRCSRRFFPQVIGLFKRLGFQLRERFHAGREAGWGAQVLAHPVTGIVIFADLDLAPDEADQDFSHCALPDLPRLNTVGLWVGLHGESLLDAGMHHLEAQFDFDLLREALLSEAAIETMKPFSNFPFLRQAFTEGERWVVSPRRVDRLLALGCIDAEQHARFLAEGALGSHLENLQRREGFKGFNQRAVSAIISETDPRSRQPH